jgi:hypothetical protein
MNPEIFQSLRQARILNWTYFAHIEQFIRANLEDFKNLYTDRYWRAKMTDEDRKMASHPNRGYRWIPNYLEKQRSELQEKLLDYVVGPDNYESGLWSRSKFCYSCGVTQEDRNDFLRDMNQCLKSKSTKTPPDAFLIGLGVLEYKRIRSACFQETSTKYDPKVSLSMSEERWEMGSIPFAATMDYGFCNGCWDDIKKQSQELIRRFK